MQTAAILAPANALHIHALPVRHQVRVSLLLIPRLVGYDQLAEAAAEGLLRSVAKNASELPVHTDDPIVHAHQGDSLRRLFEQLIEKSSLLLKPIHQRGQQSNDEDHHRDDANPKDTEGRDAHGVG